jgi:hypothetical protein
LKDHKEVTSAPPFEQFKDNFEALLAAMEVSDEKKKDIMSMTVEAKWKLYCQFKAAESHKQKVEAQTVSVTEPEYFINLLERKGYTLKDISSLRITLSSSRTQWARHFTVKGGLAALLEMIEAVSLEEGFADKKKYFWINCLFWPILQDTKEPEYFYGQNGYVMGGSEMHSYLAQDTNEGITEYSETQSHQRDHWQHWPSSVQDQIWGSDYLEQDCSDPQFGPSVQFYTYSDFYSMVLTSFDENFNRKRLESRFSPLMELLKEHKRSFLGKDSIDGLEERLLQTATKETALALINNLINNTTVCLSCLSHFAGIWNPNQYP